MPLQITESGAATLAATQIINQVNNVFHQVSGYLENGIPAQGQKPAISSVDLQAAIGEQNLTMLKNALAAMQESVV